MEPDKKLRTEYSLSERVKRTVKVLDAHDNEINTEILVAELHGIMKNCISKISLSTFPDEFVFCVNTVRHLLKKSDETVFDDGLSMFFGMLMAAFMDNHGYRIESVIEPITLADIGTIEDRLTERVMHRANRASIELMAYRQNLFTDLDILEEAIRGEANENIGTSQNSGGSGPPNGDDEECPENISELSLGGNNPTD